MKKHSRDFIHAVIESAGGTAKVSRAFKISDAAVSRWKTNRSIPPNRAAKLSKMTKGKYSPHQLCPEVFPKGMK